MSDETPPSTRPLTAALTHAATTAGFAPSVHNTQPWRWRVLPDALELHAVRQRQLTAIDPERRLLTLSCGAALHHARTALAVEGWTARVNRLPEPGEPDLLARLADATPVVASTEAMRLVQSMRIRHTDRRPVSEDPVPRSAVEAIVQAASQERGRLHILRSEQVLELAVAATRAAMEEAEDPTIRAELAYWTGRAERAGTGLTPEVLPEQAPQTTVPARDFGRVGTLKVGPGHDRAAAYALLFGDDDEPVSWLRAGEALSAAWLTATRLGISVVPLSSVVEVLSTRQALRRMLSGLGYPYLVLRLGVADPTHAGPPRTPRLAAAQVVDTSAVRHDQL